MNRIRDDNQHHRQYNPPIQCNYNAANYSQAAGAGVYNNIMSTPMIYSRSHIDTQLDTNSNQERRTVSVGSGGSLGTTDAYAQGVPTSLVPDNISLPYGGGQSGTSVMETTGMNETSGYGQAFPVNDMPQIHQDVIQGQNHVVPGTVVNNGYPVSHFVVLLFILVLLLIYMNTL